MKKSKRGKTLKHGLFKNGGKKSLTYISWIQCKQRCFNKNHNFYANYGGRGITVCDRWKNSFENFLEDMGERIKGKTLDRINNNGNYEPNNCRWATSKQQTKNRRDKKNSVIISGLTPKQYGKKYKLKLNTIYRRLTTGWDTQSLNSKPNWVKKSNAVKDVKCLTNIITSERNKLIIKLRGQGLSQRSIGKEVGLSGERVRQIIIKLKTKNKAT